MRSSTISNSDRDRHLLLDQYQTSKVWTNEPHINHVITGPNGRKISFIQQIDASDFCWSFAKVMGTPPINRIKN